MNFNMVNLCKASQLFLRERVPFSNYLLGNCNKFIKGASTKGLSYGKHYLEASDSFCKNENKINKIIDSSGIKFTPAKLRSYVLSNLSNEYQDANKKELDNLFHNITQSSGGDFNVIEKRLSTINNSKSTYMYSLFEKKLNNAGFILDNFDVINSKIFTNKNFRMMRPDQFDLTNLLSKQNLKDVIQKIDSPDFRKFANKLIYDSKEHKILFGNETVKLDSSDIVSLLSERQAISYMKGDTKTFNQSINSLTEKSYRICSDYICPYNKVAEGILTQKPELAQIAKDYQKYLSEYVSGDRIRYMERFFENLDASVRLSKVIELKTIVPDENALNCQGELLDIFLARKNLS